MIGRWRKRPKTRTQITIALVLIIMFLTLVTNLFLSSERNLNSRSIVESSKPIDVRSTNKEQRDELLKLEEIFKNPVMEEVHKSRKSQVYKKIVRKRQRSRSLFMANNHDEKEDEKEPIFAGDRIVHIDLKGAPISMGYFRELFPLLRKLGATGVLMEYEDMFPYSGPLNGLRTTRHNPFSNSDLKEIVVLAEKNSLEIIPLIQTFGHMEFILKRQIYAQMRESPLSPQSICPTHNDTLGLITEMVDQIMAIHPNVRHLHIGCDKVRLLGKCEKCALLMSNNDWMPSDLFLFHVTRTAKYIRQRYPAVRPLIWDDHLRTLDKSELRSWNVAGLVEPVVWSYNPHVAETIPSEVWDKYATVFPAVWIASAFKGAAGRDQYITDIGFHLANHYSWKMLVAEYADRLVFKGIMLMGWQRYEHFGPLCELLPVAIPSLAVNLAYLQMPFNGSISDVITSAPPSVVEALQCEGTFALTPKATIRCDFPGAAVLEAAQELYVLERAVDERNAIYFPQDDSHMKCAVSPIWAKRMNKKLSSWLAKAAKVKRHMATATEGIFDDFTREEWIETLIARITLRQKKLLNTGKSLLLCKDSRRNGFEDSLNIEYVSVPESSGVMHSISFRDILSSVLINLFISFRYCSNFILE